MCKLNSAAHDRIIMPHYLKQAAFIKWVPAELPICPAITAAKQSLLQSRCHYWAALNAGANYLDKVYQ